ncbi:DUF5753 domain-containing protein [Pseudonocardia saturnea]
MDVTTEPNPTLARRRLAVRLRALRERDGRNLADLAEYLSVSLAQASRLDTGARGFKAAHIEKLADWYAVKGPERDLLGSLAAESQKRAWWQQIELPDSYRTLIGLEQGAESVSEYCGSVLPGLLQTVDYAQAAAEGSSFDVSDEMIARAAEVRTMRQQILDRERPPLLWFIVDEAALARTTGGGEVMSRQLTHLLDASAAPRTTVQIVGFEAGTHLGTTSLHFILLDMGEEVPDVVYTEGQTDPSDTEDPAEVSNYRRKWSLLSALALDPQSSRDRISRYLGNLTG